MDSLWEVVETSSDNMVTFAKLVSRFAGYIMKPGSRNSTGEYTTVAIVECTNL